MSQKPCVIKPPAFLGLVAALVVELTLLLTGSVEASDPERSSGADFLPSACTFIPGPVNGALIRREGRTLAVYGDRGRQEAAADLVLLTEARTDVTWAARALARSGAKVVAPEKESALLEHPERFWAEWGEKRFHDYAEQSARVAAEGMAVSRAVKDGDVVSWAGLMIRVLETPGYTRDAVSYVVELEGKKVAFTGDLIRDDGKLQDLFSLQDAIPSAKIGGYHGWAGRLGELLVSLDRLAAQHPDLLIPARGPIIRDPAEAIRRLKARIRAVYANYLSIDALRWYFKDDHIRAKARRVLGEEARVDWMEMAETVGLPEEIIPISNSRLILSADGSGFLVDCGGKGIVQELRKLRAAGKLRSVEHVFVTHYHDDHTDALPLLVAEFGARVHACGSLADVIEHPGDYRLPCLTKNQTPVTARHRPGESWRWKEYRLQIFDFPGQTLHHNALLVERRGGWKAFFAGDSFTPSGIDDYCLQNRNFLREGQGYLRCLQEVARLPQGCLILNQHVGPAFRFAPAQVSRMESTLRERLPLLKALLPFDDPNFGLDDGWVTVHPYWATAQPGAVVRRQVRIMNHSGRTQQFRATVRAPAGFTVSALRPVKIGSGREGALDFTVQVPAETRPGVYVLSADVSWDGAELRECVQGAIEVVPRP